MTNKIIEIPKFNLAIEVSYNKAVQTASETLSPNAYNIYKTICSFKNGSFMLVTSEEFAGQLNITVDAFRYAINELINNKYLNFTQVTHNNTTYIGNAFQFIADNSLVAVIPSGYTAQSKEEYELLVEAWKKPYFFTGKVTADKEVF